MEDDAPERLGSRSRRASAWPDLHRRGDSRSCRGRCGVNQRLFSAVSRHGRVHRSNQGPPHRGDGRTVEGARSAGRHPAGINKERSGRITTKPTKEKPMYKPDNVKTSPDLPVPETMRAWVLGDPDQLTLTTKPVPVPKKAEVLVRIDAVAICATDLEIIHHGPPAMIQGGLPYNKNFTPGHEYMGTVAALGPGVDEYKIGERVTVEIHAGCGQCTRCREGMYTSCHNYCLNYGDVDERPRAKRFTTHGGFCEYPIQKLNTL